MLKVGKYFFHKVFFKRIAFRPKLLIMEKVIWISRLFLARDERIEQGRILHPVYLYLDICSSCTYVVPAWAEETEAAANYHGWRFRVVGNFSWTEKCISLKHFIRKAFFFFPCPSVESTHGINQVPLESEFGIDICLVRSCVKETPLLNYKYYRKKIIFQTNFTNNSS